MSNETVHLFDGVDNIGYPQTWCGKIDPKYSEDPAEVTCPECLSSAMAYAKRVLARMEELTRAGAEAADIIDRDRH